MEKVKTLEYNKNDSESTRQEKNKILVDREIYSLFSYPVGELQEKGIINIEDIENFYREPTKREIQEEVIRNDEELLKEYEIYKKESIKEGVNLSQSFSKWLYIIKGEKDLWDNTKEDLTEPQEIYEYWIVSDWFFEKLKDLNEPVIEWAGLSIWGRTCTGQSICLDYTIDEIRKTLN